MINKIDVDELKKQFIQNDRRYVIIDNMFDSSFIKECESEFKDLNEDDFVKYSNKYFEFDKYTMNDKSKMSDKLKSLFDYIHSEEFIDIISSLTGINQLLKDEDRWGGGLHKTKPGGYLSIHKDFNVLPSTYTKEKQWLRCLNLIGYISEDWNDGGLEIWNDTEGKSINKIKNKFNRWVLFDTRDCYHGHPYPLKGSERLSIASYYYIEKPISSEIWSSTEYLKLPWMEDSEEYQKERKERSDYKKRYSKLLK